MTFDPRDPAQLDEFDEKQKEEFVSSEDISSLIAYIHELEARTKWENVSSAPKDGTHIIAWSPFYKRAFIGWWNTASQCWESHGTSLFEEREGELVTHWMPLPPAPEENRGGE